MKQTFLSLLLCFCFSLPLITHAQDAHFSLITPDSGPIDVKWDYRFFWNDKDELNLIIKVPTNIELVGHNPRPTRDGIEYELPVRDLFIKVNTVMLGTNRRILSSQGLTIQINDQKRGIVKREEHCPRELDSPLFSRSIISQRCQIEVGGHLISESGYVNGAKYENSYHIREIADQSRGQKKLVRVPKNKMAHMNHSENRGQEFSLGISTGLLNRSDSTIGDGLYFSALAASDIKIGRFSFAPSMKVGLFGLASNEHNTPFRSRRDEINLAAGYTPAAAPRFKAQVHAKTFGRTEDGHYYMGLAVGAGFHFQLVNSLPLELYSAFFPHLSTRHFQLYRIGLSYPMGKTTFALELDRESFNKGEAIKTELFGANVNVTRRF